MAFIEDIAVDRSGDIIIDGGDLVFVSGVDAIAQRLAIRLKQFRGEWYLDTTVGVPYLGPDGILGKNRDREAVEAVIKNEILDTPGVLNIKSFSLDNVTGRTWSITFTVETTDGAITDTVEV